MAVTTLYLNAEAEHNGSMLLSGYIVDSSISQNKKYKPNKD